MLELFQTFALPVLAIMIYRICWAASVFPLSLQKCSVKKISVPWEAAMRVLQMYCALLVSVRPY